MPNSKLTVIYYHDIVPDGMGKSYQKVEVSAFKRQMEYLFFNGYNTISLYDLHGPLPAKAVAVTFDDGFRSVLDTALPIMNRYNIKGGVFLTTGFMDNPGEEYLGWGGVDSLLKSGLFSFGSHTHTHVDIRNICEDQWIKESVHPKSEIESRTGCKADAFCMPYGMYNYKSLKKLKVSGIYKYLFTSHYGSWGQSSQGVNVLPRIGIRNEDKIETFKAKLQGKMDYIGIPQKLRLILQNLKHQ